MKTKPSAPIEPDVAPETAAPKKTNPKLMWASGAGVVAIAAVLVTCGTFSSTSGSVPPKAAIAPETKPVVTTVAETKPAPVPVTNGVYGTAVWIPIYPGSTPEITSTAQTPESDQYLSTFKTTDAPTKVVSYFQDQLTSAGFSIKAASSGEENGSLQAEDGLKKRTLVLNVNTMADTKGSDARLVTIEKK